MPYDPETHRRRSIRLCGYDYTRAGAYFITVCTHHRARIFGTVTRGVMQVAPYGRIVQACWDDLPRHYPHVILDAFVIMPDHVHGILVLDGDERAGLKPAPTGHKRCGLPEIVREFKTCSSRRINDRRATPGERIWQQGYWERILRTDAEWQRVRQYIADNPMRWHLDRFG